jgi:hypothetical protein
MLLVLRTQGCSGFLNIRDDFGTDDSRAEAPRTNDGFRDKRKLACKLKIRYEIVKSPRVVACLPQDYCVASVIRSVQGARLLCGVAF